MVEYKSKVFVWSLIAFVILLLLFNGVQLLLGAPIWSAVSIAIQAAVLYALLKKTMWVKTAVRVWSGFMAFSGLWPLFLAAPSMSSTLLITVVYAIDYSRLRY